jgi:hypothetical protein
VITVSRSGERQFYRISGAEAVSITEIRISGDDVIITYN